MLAALEKKQSEMQIEESKDDFLDFKVVDRDFLFNIINTVYDGRVANQIFS